MDTTVKTYLTQCFRLLVSARLMSFYYKALCETEILNQELIWLLVYYYGEYPPGKNSEGRAFV